MSTIKETILHPDGNEGVDLYPKTNINQVQELPQKLTSVENQINQLNIDKLTKPTNPSAESAVTMLADGTVGTKLLSEIGGGGKLYKHSLIILFNEFIGSGNITIYSTSLTKITALSTNDNYIMTISSPTMGGIVRLSTTSSTNSADFYGVVSSSGGEATAYYARSFTISSVSDKVTEI